MVDLFQQGPGLFQFLGSVLVGGREKAEWLASWCIGTNLVASPFSTFRFWLEGMLNTGCMNRVQQVWGAWRCGFLSEGRGWLDGLAAGAGLVNWWWRGGSVNIHSWLL